MRSGQSNCSRMQPLLEEYFEGILPSQMSARVSEHLATCARCAAKLCQIERVVAAFEAAPQAAPSEALLPTLRARVAQLPAPREAQTARGWRWLAVTAAVSVSALAAVSYLLPLLITDRLAADIRALHRLEDAAVFVRQWFDAAPAVMLALWMVLGKIAHWFALTARAVAPTLGVYVAAEIGILSAIVFVLHSRSRRTLVRQTLPV